MKYLMAKKTHRFVFFAPIGPTLYRYKAHTRQTECVMAVQRNEHCVGDVALITSLLLCTRRMVFLLHAVS
jgi:hypothetical protein